jgi:O-antigen ligase
VTIDWNLALSRRRYHRRAVLGAFAAGALAILGSMAVFGNFLAARMMHFDRDFSDRLALDQSVIAAIKASPWLGYGLGTFEQAYPPFRASTLQQSGRWEYAHNSWLEALMTLGVPAGLLLWVIFGWILARCLIGALRRGETAIYPTIGAGVMVIAATQSLIDFPIQIQGFAIPFLAILGVAVAQSWPRRDVAGPLHA